jgi:hypothetical protein
MILGLWLIVAPWIMGFASISAALATFVTLGIVVAVTSVSELWQVHYPAAMAK